MIKKIISIIVVLLVSAVLLALTVKGNQGDPIAYQNDLNSQVGSPFESTNSTSRYVLVKSIVERNSFFLTEEEARSSAPDLVRYNDKFMSIFTPGVSFVAVPFYILGKQFGMPQLFVYLATVLFALGNLFLISRLAVKLGSSIYAGLIGGIVFLFATNAFSYTHTLTQHHFSTFAILLALFFALQKRNLFNNLMVGVLFGVGALFDIPNVFMMLPIVFYVGFTNFRVGEVQEKIKVSLKLGAFFLVIGTIMTISIFAWYNLQTTGSYTTIGQTIGRTDYFEPAKKREENAKAIAKAKAEGQKFIPFNSRLQLESSYILVLSDERGWIYYSPVVFLGLVGFYLAFRNKNTRSISSVLIGVVGMNVVVYSMFGDPWGGWSFGPRYLIPGAAILSVFLGVAIWHLRKNMIFLLFFVLLFGYSAYVSSLGAYSTNAIPPKGEALALGTKIPWTYEYNIQLLEIDRSSSLVYNVFYKDQFPALWLVYATAATSGIIVLGLLTANALRKEKKT